MEETLHSRNPVECILKHPEEQIGLILTTQQQGLLEQRQFSSHNYFICESQISFDSSYKVNEYITSFQIG